MKKAVIKSNSAFVLVGESPSWTTGEDRGRLLSLVQNCDFSIDTQRQKIKQLGSQNYAVNDVMFSPDVNLTIDYFLSPCINNELLIGMKGVGDTYQPSLDGIRSKNNNIYLLMDTKNGTDGFDEPRRSDPENINFSGFHAVSFGNCYCNKYSVSFALNSIPTASLGFVASNVRFESLTGNKMPIPAINLESGNNSGSGFLDLSNLLNTITGNFIAKDKDLKTEYTPPIASPTVSSFSLEQLDIGGVDLRNSANPILQSFSFDLDLSRTPLYGLGSNYAYRRLLQFPVNGQAQLSCLFSGVSTGSLQQILTNENEYSFEVSFCDEQKLNTGYFQITDAKLDSINYSMQVNGIMQVNASFSFEASPSDGFFMKRSVNQGDVWQNIYDLWQNLNVTWSSME